jgi:hypothetical protein
MYIHGIFIKTGNADTDSGAGGVSGDAGMEPGVGDVTGNAGAELGAGDVTDDKDTEPGTGDVTGEVGTEPGAEDVTGDVNTELKAEDATGDTGTEFGARVVTDNVGTEPGVGDVTGDAGSEPGAWNVIDNASTEPRAGGVTGGAVTEPGTGDVSGDVGSDPGAGDVTCDADTESGADNVTGDAGTEPGARDVTRDAGTEPWAGDVPVVELQANIRVDISDLPLLSGTWQRGSDSFKIAQDDRDRYLARLFEINQQRPVADEPDCQRSESLVTQISSKAFWQKRKMLIVWTNNVRQGTWSAGWWMGQSRSEPLPITQVSRSSMVSKGPDGPTFILLNWYHLSAFLALGVLVLLLVFFVVKKPLGGILQAVLTFVVPTYQARKHFGWDLKLENSVCWVCTMCMIITGSLLTGLLLLIDLYQWTILPGAASFGLPGALCGFDSIPCISPDALWMSALLFGVYLLALLIKSNLCPIPSWKTAKRSRPPKTWAATSRALSGAVCLLCMLIVRLYLGNAGLMYVLFATLVHVVRNNGSYTSLSQLPGSIIIWLLVTWLVSSFWISSQPHKDSHTNPVLKRWRVIGFVGLVILGLFYLR